MKKTKDKVVSEGHFAILGYTAETWGFTPCQFEHYVRTKFATPILHAIDNF